MSKISSGSLTVVDVKGGSDGINTATIYLYQRATTAPSKPSTNLTYTFATAKLTGGLGSWTQDIGTLTGNDPIWVIAAVASSNGTTDVIESTEWSEPIKMAQDGQSGEPGQPGAKGLNQATIFIYKRDDTATKPNSVTYTFATGSFTVPTGWSTSIPQSNGKPCWVCSAVAIGSDDTAQLNWTNPSVMVEDGSDGVSPVVTSTDNGVQIYDPINDVTYTITNGADGTSYYTHILYSSKEVPTSANDVSNSPENKDYVGILTTNTSAVPAWNDSRWIWKKYIGEDGQPGTQGDPGPQGVSVTGTRELYYLKTNSASVPSITSTSQIDSVSKENGWTSVVPTYVGGGTYYTCIETSLSTGGSVWSVPVENKGLTNANKNASEAIDIATGVRQHFFWFPEDISEGIPSGAYVAEENESTFKNGPTKGNILTRSDGIWIRNGVDKLATLQGSGLTFLVPTGTYKGQKSVSLNGSGLTFYNIGSSNSAAATLASNGLQITNGSITLGNYFSVTNQGVLTAKSGTIGGWSFTDNALYYSNATPGYSTSNLVISKNSAVNANAIAGSETNKHWFLAAGRNFGVDTDGVLYASGANIQGQVTITAGSNVYTKDEVDDAVVDATAELISAKEANGNIVHVEDASEYPALDCKISLEPIQDLNGYDKPWVGGAGKNLIDSRLSVVQAVNTSGTWNNNAYTLNGLTFTVADDGHITINGTSTANTYFTVYRNSEGITLPTGSYVLHKSGSADIIVATPKNGAFWTSATINDSVVSLTESARVSYYVQIQNGKTISNYNLYPMFEEGSTASDWSPYSNICPISGRTEVNTIVSPTTSASDGRTYTTALGRTVYGGTLDVVSGELTVDRAYALLNDASKWAVPSGSTVDYRYNETFTRKFYSDSFTGLICSIAQVRSGSGVSYTARWTGAGAGFFGIVDRDGLTSLDEIKQLASNNEIAICYDIEPQTYQLTPQEVELLTGTNNVWSDGGDIHLKYVTMNSDMLSLMDKSNADLSRVKAEIKVTTDGISSEVSKKTDKDSIISTIRQSAETVKIKASQVEIDGTATFNAIKSQTDAAYDAINSASAVQTSLEAAAVAEEQYIYISKASGTTSVSKTTTWVTETGDKQNTWTTKRPTYDTSYPVLFVAKQKKVVSGTVTCTTPVKDDTTTIIDGGHITTGTIDSNRLNADTIKVNAANIQGSLTIGQLPSTVAETSDIPTKVSELTNDSGYQNSTQVSSAIDEVRSYYIADIDSQNGITIKAVNGTTSGSNTDTQNYIKLNADGLDIYKGGKSVAMYGDTARLGEATSARLTLGPEGLGLYDTNSVRYFNIESSVGATNTYVDRKITDASGGTGAVTTDLSSDASVADIWSNLATGAEFFIRIAWFYYNSSGVCIATKEGGDSFKKGTTKTSNSYVKYTEPNTLTFTASYPSVSGASTVSRMAHLEVEYSLFGPVYQFCNNPTSSNGAYCFMTGNGVQTNYDYQTAVGRYNDPDFVDDGPEDYRGLFFVGGGASDAYRKNAMVVTHSDDPDGYGSDILIGLDTEICNNDDEIAGYLSDLGWDLEVLIDK